VSVVLRHTIYNELSTARNPNNMPLISVVFQTKPESAAQVTQPISLRKYQYILNIANK